MAIPPQAAGGGLAAECAPLGDPSRDLPGAVGAGAAVACAGVRARKRAGPKPAGEGARPKRVRRGRHAALGACLGHTGICGRAEHARVFELGMGPESDAGGIVAVLGWGVLGWLRVTLGGPGGTGAIGRRERA